MAVTRRRSPLAQPSPAKATLLLACVAALSGCDAKGSPQREDGVTIWAKARKTTPSVTVVSPSPGAPVAMTSYDQDDWYFARLPLSPGEHGYLVTDDSGEHADPYNPLTTYAGAAEVSLAIVPDCTVPEVRIDTATGADDGTITLQGRFYRACETPDDRTARLGPISASDARGGLLSAVTVDPETGTFTLRGSGFSRGKHTFTIEAEDGGGRRATAPLAVAWVKPAHRRWDEGILYQVLIDRFRGDGGAPLAPPETPGMRAGGTLDGVRAAIESGYFDDLGVSALWLSPVYQNPEGLLPGRDGQMYEGYHGYWPLASRGVEPRIGGEQALHAAIEAAHARGIAVLFDLVPNHVYDQNPRYLEHAQDGWFNDGPSKCVCGAPGCGWDKRIQDCWFAPYLPDVKWQSSDSLHAQLDDLDFWMRSFDADGVRIDAVPMMPRLATRRLSHLLQTRVAPEGASFGIGEVFTGGGHDGLDAIKYFLGKDSLSGAFDFPLAWALRGAIAHRTSGFDAVEDALAYPEKALAGSGAVLGRMIDNHDMPRFLSEANGDGGSNAWSSPAKEPVDERVYSDTLTAMALILTVPGMPVIFHGDEVGLPGGSDPDNRRVLPDEAALSASQRRLLETTRRLGRLRACSEALKTGSRNAFLVTDHTYGFARVAPSEAALVMISTEDEPVQIVPPLKAVPPGSYVDALSRDAFEVGQGAPVDLAPHSFRILLPENSPCLSAVP